MGKDLSNIDVLCEETIDKQKRFIVDYTIFFDNRFNNAKIVLRCLNHCPKGKTRIDIFFRELFKNQLVFAGVYYVNMSVDILLNELQEDRYDDYIYCYFCKFSLSKRDLITFIENCNRVRDISSDKNFIDIISMIKSII